MQEDTQNAGDWSGDQGLNQDAERELTFGEKAVGLTFNPSNNAAVQRIKEKFASIIDYLESHREVSDGEEKRMLSIAITEAQTAQMWAVKAVTWQS